MKKILLLISISILCSCVDNHVEGEKCVLMSICADLCTKYGGSNSYSFSVNENAFNNIFNYWCVCYPKVGFDEPIKIEVSLKKAEDVSSSIKAKNGGKFPAECNTQ